MDNISIRFPHGFEETAWIHKFVGRWAIVLEIKVLLVLI